MAQFNLWYTDKPEWTIIAETDDNVLDFGPYVASINDHGQCAFFAEHRAPTGRAHGLFVGDGRSVRRVFTTSASDQYNRLLSHPDINNAGQLCIYGQTKLGHTGLICCELDSPTSPRAQSILGIGPLGPTINEFGQVALRAFDTEGRAVVMLGDEESGFTTAIAAEAEIIGFQGLPLVLEEGALVVRVDCAESGQAVLRIEGDERETLVETGSGVDSLNRFPHVVGDQLVFCATQGSQSSLIVSQKGNPRILLSTSSIWSSFRGALFGSSGRIIHFSEAAHGCLGAYFGPDPVDHALLVCGQNFLGDKLVDFALNPVSINANDQIVLRVKWQSGRQAIVRGQFKI